MLDFRAYLSVNRFAQRRNLDQFKALNALYVGGLFWLTDEQMAKLSSFLSKVDRQAAGRWQTGPSRHRFEADPNAAYGLHKTLYSRWKRWSEKGIFAQMMAGLAAEHGEKKTV
ncbi:hypothetical protein ADUPG1_007608, partial [Aduncisulcus paluster]